MRVALAHWPGGKDVPFVVRILCPSSPHSQAAGVSRCRLTLTFLLFPVKSALSCKRHHCFLTLCSLPRSFSVTDRQTVSRWNPPTEVHSLSCVPSGGEVVKIAQLASLAGPPSRVAQPETPVTLQFQGNKFTLSHSQLRQLTAGQPLQLQGEPCRGAWPRGGSAERCVCLAAQAWPRLRRW